MSVLGYAGEIVKIGIAFWLVLFAISVPFYVGAGAYAIVQTARGKNV